MNKREENKTPDKLKAYDYRWIGISLIALLLLIASIQKGYCQSLVTSNPGEYTVLAAGNILINETVKKETSAQRETAAQIGRAHV